MNLWIERKQRKGGLILVQSTKPRRIHIMGGPGSGKSTLAQALSISLEAPYYELDVVAYEGGFGRKIPLEVKAASLRHH